MQAQNTYLDACIYIKLWSPNRPKCPHISRILTEVEEGKRFIVASTLIGLECLNEEMFRRLERSMDGRKGLFIDPEPPIVSLAQRIRTKLRREGITLQSMDVLHLATAINTECIQLITEDGPFLEKRDALLPYLGDLKILLPSETVDQRVFELEP